MRVFESETVYRSYTYFMQEQLFASIGSETLSTQHKLSLFKAGWHMYLIAKSELLSNTGAGGLECTFLLISIMLMLDDWAKKVFSNEIVLALCHGVKPAIRRAEDDQSMLATVQEIFNSSLNNLITFQESVFQPFALVSLVPLLPLPPTVPNTPNAKSNPSFLSNFCDQLSTLSKRTKSLLLDFPLDRLEFDELKYLQEEPLSQLYPEISPDARVETGEQANTQPTLCFNSMYQIHSQLMNLRWLDRYASSKAFRKDNSEANQTTSSTGSPATPSQVTLDDLVSEARMSTIRAKVDGWARQILQDTKMPNSSLALSNQFFYRLLLDILIEDADQHGKDTQPSTLIDSDNFVATLFAVSFEIAMFCLERADVGCNTFPYILGVVRVQTMDCCKLLASAMKLFTPFTKMPEGIVFCRIKPAPPKPVLLYLSHLEERAISEHVWKPGSSVLSTYNDATQSFFAYVLSTAGPPSMPRMAVQTALMAPKILDKFCLMWFDSGSRNTAPAASTTSGAPQANGTGMANIHWEAHGIFCKLLRIGCTRIRALCSAIPLMTTQPTLIAQAELAFSQIVTQRTSFLVGKHVDTLAICSICSIICLLVPNPPGAILRTLIQIYTRMPNCNDFAVTLVPARYPNTTTLKYLNIYDFYATVFTPELAPLFSKFKKAEPTVSNYSPSFSKHSPSKILDRRRSSIADSAPNHTPSALNQWASTVYAESNEMRQWAPGSGSSSATAPFFPTPPNSQPVSASQTSSSTLDFESPVHRNRNGKRTIDDLQGHTGIVPRKLDFSSCISDKSGKEAPAPQGEHNSPPTRATRRSTRGKSPKTQNKENRFLPMIKTPPKTRPPNYLEDDEYEENEPSLIQPQRPNGAAQAPKKQKLSSSPPRVPNPKRARSD